MQSLPSFLLFALVAAVTPGPTNILVLANASRHGLAAAVPMMFGASAGAASVLLLVSSGLGVALAGHPLLRTLLGWAGLAWLSVLAWQLFRAAGGDSDQAGRDGRLGFIGTAGLQFINPKAWIMALAATGVFAVPEGGDVVSSLWYAGVFFLVALPGVAVWAWLGSGAARWITRPESQRLFNRSMALLLLVSAWSTLLI